MRAEGFVENIDENANIIKISKKLGKFFDCILENKRKGQKIAQFITNNFSQVIGKFLVKMIGC